MRIGIDIGGTKAVIALVTEEGRIAHRRQIKMDARSDCAESLVPVAGALKDLLVEGNLSLCEISSVGIGVPGTVDAQGRTVVHAPNLGWIDEPVAERFEALCGLSPRLVQDTRAAALAEARIGAGAGRRVVACITLGTGIGCGIVVDGQIYEGPLGTAGEIGHIPVVSGGRMCNCGRTGCMEAYASGTGIARAAKERGVAETSEEVFRLAERGDGRARAIIEEAVAYAAMGLCALINVLSPDAVLLSGGLSAQTALYVDPLIRAIRERAYALAVTDKLVLAVAALGTDAPVIGAALL